VVFPQPLGPTTATVSPEATLIETPSSAVIACVPRRAVNVRETRFSSIK
jgi:hypothetical protein